MRKDIRTRWNDNPNNSMINQNNSSSNRNSERTKIGLGKLHIDAPSKKVAAGIAVGGFFGFIFWELWKSNRKKSEDNNKSKNNIKEDDNRSANRIKENSASTDNKIRLKKEEYEQKKEFERLKHEQWKDKQEYKIAKTDLILPEITTHPLLSYVDIRPKSRNLNYYGSEEVKQAQALYDNLIYKDETAIIFSPTNVGKTFASIQIGAEISEKIPDSYTLYYNQEMSDSQVQTLLFGSKKRPKYAENMDIISDICTEEELIKDMVLNIEQYRKNLTIFVDNITDLCPSSRNEKATEFLKLLKRIRINAYRIYRISLTFVIICHTNKIVKGSKLELENVKGCGNLNNFADRIIGIGRVPNHNDKRYFKILKGRTGVVKSDEVMIFKFFDDKPRLRCIGDAYEDDVVHGKYKEPKEKISENDGETWYFENMKGKGYGAIAREHFKLPVINDNDTAEVKKEKKKRFEKCTDIVKYQIKKYKESLSKRSA